MNCIWKWIKGRNKGASYFCYDLCMTWTKKEKERKTIGQWTWIKEQIKTGLQKGLFVLQRTGSGTMRWVLLKLTRSPDILHSSYLSAVRHDFMTCHYLSFELLTQNSRELLGNYQLLNDLLLSQCVQPKWSIWGCTSNMNGMWLDNILSQHSSTSFERLKVHLKKKDLYYV